MKSKNKTSDKPKRLYCFVTREVYDEAVAGKIRTIYKELTAYWLPRLVYERSDEGNHVFREYDEVCLRTRSGKNLEDTFFEFKGISVDHGHPNHGVSEDRHYFLIDLGNIINIKQHKLYE